MKKENTGYFPYRMNGHPISYMCFMKFQLPNLITLDHDQVE